MARVGSPIDEKESEDEEEGEAEAQSDSDENAIESEYFHKFEKRPQNLDETGRSVTAELEISTGNIGIESTLARGSAKSLVGGLYCFETFGKVRYENHVFTNKNIKEDT